MKDIKEILKHLPLPYDKIEKQRCLQMIVSHLPQHLQKGVVSIFLKGETIYFRTLHPAINFELYQKLQEIKKILNSIHQQKKCLSIKINNIKCFTNFKNEKITSFTSLQLPLKTFPERLNGDFENKATDPHLYKKFEEIRKTIKRKKEKLLKKEKN